jgi:hypothetical protein
MTVPPESATTRIRPSVPPPDRGDEDTESGPGRWKWWVLAGVAAVLVVGVGAWILLERSDAPAPRGSSTPAATVTASPAPVTPTATATPVDPAGDVERAVEEHWSLILAGRYEDAYETFAPTFQARNDRAGWIQAREEDGLSSVEVESHAQVDPSGSTAHTAVVAMRTVATSGCFTWTGSYGLQLVEGAWRIADSNLTRQPC